MERERETEEYTLSQKVKGEVKKRAQRGESEGLVRESRVSAVTTGARCR